MDPFPRYRPRNPYNDGRDLGLLMIFFLTFLLMGGIIAVLTVGTAWTLPEVGMPQVVAVETRTGGLFGADVIEQPPIVNRATPTATGSARLPIVTSGAPLTETGTPQASGAAPGQTPGPGPTQTPRASPTPTQVQGSRLVVGNTGGVGAWLRRSPRMNDYVIALNDGTPLEVVGPDVQAEGRVWKNVRDPRGNQGFIPAEWAVSAP